MVQIINDMNEFKAFLTAAGHKLAVVEFSSKWCGPCKRMVPVFHAMSVKYQNVFFANVDVNNSPELAETCHIKIIPTFQMFKKSQKKKMSLWSQVSSDLSWLGWFTAGQVGTKLLGKFIFSSL
ncbi:PREDICTED: thioredoxin domain-containing protein 8 isoform X3 [Rhinopithecus bieti]|uniref:thioredoxin domain-containing protein 8 isoform X3 n=1 Tax=Rhinopithecus bieti TaxID=61621 RepID=UPI00083C6B7D|nr:PREDICTED: thioredoxin domain-containing protein 8 isoform X3 [Rhinopithecus bieti]